MPNLQAAKHQALFAQVAAQYGGLDRPAPAQFPARNELTELERMLLETAEAQEAFMPGIVRITKNAIMDERAKNRKQAELETRIANVEGFLGAAVNAAMNNRRPQTPKKIVRNTSGKHWIEHEG